MQPMAARLGVDHQRRQQFITSSTWDYMAVRRNIARHFAGNQAVFVDRATDASLSSCAVLLKIDWFG